MPDPILSVVDAISTRIDDEMIVMAITPESSHYYGLRGAGIRIWEAIKEGGRGRRDLVAQLQREYDVDEGMAGADVDRIVDGLIARGVVREG